MLRYFAQAVLLLRFVRQHTAVTDLARDNHISLSSAYRYLHETLDVIAVQALNLSEVISEAVRAGHEHLLLNGTLIPRRSHPRPRPRSRWLVLR
ncbi:hypothetical protein [Quadrisphaera sp. DSM 44207]|uniref:hypothetical protein n=1 Tax=Quadrisphaera sp. DSM 44207 TaxID=1881057 RepID=UPI000B896448